jgi:hypothetical protein
MNYSIFPETPPPATPEHNRISAEEGNFIQRARVFMDYLASQGYILIKPESENIRISGDYERIHLGANDEPLKLVMAFMEIDFDAWQSENDALQRWASRSAHE